jgi:predicted dehydrogenase
VTAPGTTILRLGVLGCGRVFEKFHLPAIDRVPTVALMAAHDPNPARLAWSAARSQPPSLFDSAAALVGSGNLDALLVLTPPAHHTEAVILGLEAGLHVLVEKPMALEPDQGRRMLQAAQATRRKLHVGFSRRFREPYQRLRKMLTTIAEPDIRSAYFELSFPTGAWKARTDFLGHEALGGDAFHDVLSHQVDLVCWLLGKPEAVRAWVGDPAAGTIQAELRFTYATIRCQASHGTYAERFEVELSGRQMLQATGSGARRTGRHRWPWRRRRYMVLDRLALISDRLRRRPSVSLVSFERQLRDFERSIRGGKADGAGGEDGLLAVEIVHACRLSARDGGRWRAITAKAAPVG